VKRTAELYLVPSVSVVRFTDSVFSQRWSQQWTAGLLSSVRYADCVCLVTRRDCWV